MKQSNLFCIILLLIFVVLAGCTSTEETNVVNSDVNAVSVKEEGSREIKIVTSKDKNTYSILGEILAKQIINTNVDNVTTSLLSSERAIASLYEVVDGHADFAIVETDIAYYATHATDLFEGNVPITGFHGVASIYPEVLLIIASQESEIQTVEELAGKKVAVGQRGSTTEAKADQILKLHGVSFEEMNTKSMDIGEAIENIKDGTIDAAFITTTMEYEEIDLLNEKENEISFISMSVDKTADIEGEFPYFISLTIPKDVFDTPAEVTTVANQVMLIVNSSVDDDIVYEVTKAIMENEEKISNQLQLDKNIELDKVIDPIPIDVHPGAERFYNEKQ
ncbi:TAXI family TRAP transporter solute-binding subunit [Alkalihalobacterium elongatum]|uniref:TAXI family TRAP transporter solute-binding subunit n=1 Tax=Alkalihalobacterium elongatum TaxID=2675466 RepID=UPI001C1F3623|nr:TAXI family TRAP transporter solute-binding subunit [Alkalihalobacterium elongatum]